MSASTTDLLADLRGLVRIAKAASVGVTGNAARIERAERAIANVAELIEAAKYAEQDEYTRRACVRLHAALARLEVQP
jgi:hypothetical protein